MKDELERDLSFASAWLGGVVAEEEAAWASCVRRAAALGGARLKESAVEGLGLFCARDCEPGDICFAERPCGCVPCVDDVFACDHCLADLENEEVAYRCKACGAPYCRRRCQTDAEKLYHGRLCPGASMAARHFDDHARDASNEFYLLAARLLCAYPNTNFWRQFAKTKYWNTLPRLSFRDLAALQQQMRASYDLLVTLLPATTATFDDYADLLGSLRVNAAHFRNGSVCLYATHSAINHADKPNVAVYYDENKWPGAHCIVVAKEYLTFGDELLVDYLPADRQGKDRENALKDHYGIIPS